eukprot:Gregarina_sp_Poly_1__3669@NODE_2080_length_2720_cov_125_513381_g1342_i0_p4_GENE_NODE_2080_length_2720_cov_125_513381_g1342_i0NODE_2080_length_2720_cov_125_513381_g1342_i0_p4_ORF_typecomplete_len115_score15_55Tctex1/PF03645_13/5_9e24DUF3335/PF11814_8/0_069NARP1/PF12569_8/0_096_NODE_2080_length_2720_cov_125_513381_g1342_i016211965
MEEYGEAVSFHKLSEGLKKEMLQIVKDTLTDKAYESTQIPTWVDVITSQTIDKLTKRSDALKYVVSVIILEKKNGGFHLFSTCYWDQECDGTVTVRWDNPTMHCVVSVFGLSIN